MGDTFYQDLELGVMEHPGQLESPGAFHAVPFQISYQPLSGVQLQVQRLYQSSSCTKMEILEFSEVAASNFACNTTLSFARNTVDRKKDHLLKQFYQGTCCLYRSLNSLFNCGTAAMWITK